MSLNNKLKAGVGMVDHGNALSTGEKLLHGQYTIQCYLSSGGFGVTYLARDSLDRKIVIKECFPVMTCLRKGKKVIGRTAEDQTVFEKIVRLLVHEARRMARLTHPNIVGVHQVFEENGTAYLALDFVNGQDLLEIIEHNPKRLTPDLVKNLLRKSLDAVEYMHESDILHRDISPDNILITEDDEPVLIDFGAAREVTNRASKALSALNAVKDGYSPLEFYSSIAEQSPASDLYSLAATFYHVITGDAPPDSHSRLSAIAAEELDPWEPIPVRTEGFDHYFLGAIDKALALFPKDRLYSATQWIEQIDQDRRQKALLAAARKDKGLEELIKEITNETNKALQAAKAERLFEKEMLALEAKRKAEAEAAEKAAAVERLDGEDYPMGEEWDELISGAPGMALAELEGKPVKRSLISRIFAPPLSYFTSKNKPVEAES